MLAAGGLAQARIGLPVELGTFSDERQIAGLGLARSGAAKARRLAARILELVWPDVELLAQAVVEHNVLAGETAIAYVLAAAPEPAVPVGGDAGSCETYAEMVDRRAVARARG
jgi:hypothetical protein